MTHTCFFQTRVVHLVVHLHCAPQRCTFLHMQRKSWYLVLTCSSLFTTICYVEIWVGDTKEMGVHDAKVTAFEFRVGSAGGVVWAGTKKGHLVELDVDSGEVTGTKFGAHAGLVTHIFRHQNAMVSVDETGKVLVFGLTATSGSEVPSLTYTALRVYRIAEKQEFVKLLGGLLWTSVRSDTNGSGPTTVPIVLIYDVFTQGSIARTVSVLPNTPHHVGAVTISRARGP
ncbi:hypothetical protein EDB19DRAFT_1705341, partial [Suillus lakei]